MEFEMKHSLSLKQHLKIIYSSCCNFCDTVEDDVQKSPQSHSKKHRSCCKWLKYELSKMFSTKQRRNNRRCNNKPSEFKYDPLSYSLNFEDDDSHIDEYPLRDFCSRLPPSPVKQANNNNVVVSTQIYSAWS